MASTPDAQAALRTLSALAEAAPAIALIDAGGRIAWCSQAFAHAVAGIDASVLVGTGASAWLGPAHTRLRAEWDLSEREAGDGMTLVELQPLEGAEALRRTIATLRERIALLQEFCNVGVFERDPVTMQGQWDAQMYRIFGLPVPPPGTPAPDYSEVSRRFFAQDRVDGAFAASMHALGTHSSRVRLRRADGEVRYIHAQWKVFNDERTGVKRVLGVNIDDTETFALARQAQELRTELELALELSDIGLWRHDLESGRVYLDERASRHVGIEHEPDGVTVAQIRSQTHPDDVPRVLAWLQQGFDDASTSDLPIRYRRPGGGWRHVIARRTLQRDIDGQPLALAGVLFDQTPQVEQWRHTQQLTRRLESAAESARIGLWSSSIGDDALPDWNRRNFELFGLDPAKGPLRLGDWLRRCVHPDDRERVAGLSKRLAAEGSGNFEIEFRALHTDGSVRWLVSRGQVTQTTADAPRRLEGVTLDVTELHETLQRLRESSQRIELTASAVGLGSWEYDEARSEMVWDSAMFRLRGVDSPRRSIERDEVWSYLHPDDHERVIEEQVRALEQHRPWRGSFRVVWPDGSVRWLASRSLVLYDETGRPTRRIGLNWDITEVVQAEQALRERELALAESRAKSRFLSRISHELRTPLNAVLGFTQLLRSEEVTTSADERRQWLAHIDDAGRHLLALIDDVLDLSRAESGDLRLAPEALALDALVAATLPLVRGQADQLGLTLDVDPIPPGSVWADPVRARQVLLNLLTNAIKYNRRGGRVRLRIEREDTHYRLSIADTGHGLDAAQLSAAFEPFNRLGADRLGIEGTGIGLAIVKALVEQMQGRIDASSRPGEGSEFSFTLPIASEPQAAAPDVETPAPGAAAHSTDAPPGADAPPACVLYIEDNEVNALLVRELLAPHAWVRLHTAPDGGSGVHMARQLRPDLVLLDMQLPDMDGLAVMQTLRADPLTADLRCVVLSANAMPDDVRTALQAGAIDYWTKPIELPAFVDKLAALVRPPAST